MLSDGRPLPDIAEAAVLRRAGLLRSDELPDLAARWLATNVLDTESTRILAGFDRQDPWGLDELFADAMSEAHAAEATDIPTIERTVVEWLYSNIDTDADTRAAVRSLARAYESNYDLVSFGHFSGLDDEWIGGWGRLSAELAADARNTMREILNRPNS